MSQLGKAYAEALARKDFDQVAALLHPQVDLRNGDGPFVVEQQAYIEERDGRIGWMRVVCSGFRPVRSSHGTDND